MKKENIISHPREAVEIAESMILDRHKEHFFCLALDARNRVKRRELVSMGTLNASLVHPRETFRKAIVNRAAGIIVLHNHPSGATDPSEADVELTKRLQHAGKILGIELIDHIVFCNGEFYSFKDKNAL